MKSKSILVLAVLLLVACVREGAQPDNMAVKTFDCFTVSVEDSPMTKVHLGDGGTVKWDYWDCIGVYSDTQAPVPYYRGEDGKFHGDPVTGTEFYAFYPYAFFEYDSKNPTSLKCCEVSSFVASKSMVYSNNVPMVAKGSDGHLSFKQTCGLIHFKLTGPQHPSYVTLYPRKKEAINGPGTVDLSQDNPVYNLDNGNGTLTDNHDSNVGPVSYASFNFWDNSLDDGEWDLYCPVPPMSLLEGFDLHIYLDNYSQHLVKSTERRIDIQRGQMLTFTSLGFDDLFEEREEAQNKERAALIKLYESLGGENWIHNDNWCSDRPVNEWYGVDTNQDGFVIRINLMSNINNHMVGTIPEEIGIFKYLNTLTLGGDFPYGDDDYEGGWVGISGDIPESIGNLKELLILDLLMERGAKAPDSMRNLTKLQGLSLTGIDFGTEATRPNSSDWWLNNLTELVTLYLFDCYGEFPGGFENLDKLYHVEMTNGMTGSVPLFSEKALANIEAFGVDRNYFTGTIPASYLTAFESPNLGWKFHVGRNCLTGKLPDEVVSHPLFPEYAWAILEDQKEGYGIECENAPASRYTYPTLDGGTLDLGAYYSNADYTMIVRWTESCAPSVGFVPTAISLAEKYKDSGLQTVWAYAGGYEAERIQYMEQTGLDKMSPHIIECHGAESFDAARDHAVWITPFYGYAMPHVEVVDRNGNIVFVQDENHLFTQQPFAHQRSELAPFLAELFGEVEEKYTSTDFSADGTPHTLQTASKGAGINVVLMGDAFSDRLIADGTYESVMRKAMDALFSKEPYNSYKDHFNVSYIDVVSKNEVYYGDTALNTWYGSGTRVGGNDDKVFEYARKVLAEDEMDDALFIVMMNRDYYAGTCYMYSTPDGDYGRGPSVAYFPTSSDVATFAGLVSHEAGGHGFAKLADEYDYPGRISEEEVERHQEMEVYGWWKNIDFTSDPAKVKWAKFITDERYASENIGVYEGACTYELGAWRPTENSIMRFNNGGFNAPSRESIYYRIHKLAYGNNWEYNYEDFVAYDAVNRTPAAMMARRARPKSFVEEEFQPLAPPVVIKKDWRKAGSANSNEIQYKKLNSPK